MPRITIMDLTQEEVAALWVLAKKQLREPQAQAAFIIRQALEKQGLIEVVNLPPQAESNQTGGLDDRSSC